jgi:hypothetical protein
MIGDRPYVCTSELKWVMVDSGSGFYRRQPGFKITEVVASNLHRRFFSLTCWLKVEEYFRVACFRDRVPKASTAPKEGFEAMNISSAEFPRHKIPLRLRVPSEDECAHEMSHIARLWERQRFIGGRPCSAVRTEETRVLMDLCRLWLVMYVLSGAHPPVHHHPCELQFDSGRDDWYHATHYSYETRTLFTLRLPSPLPSQSTSYLNLYFIWGGGVACRDCGAEHQTT